MIGQQYLGQRCGSFGDVSTYSFYPNKMITTGEGGMYYIDTIADRVDISEICVLTQAKGSIIPKWVGIIG